LESQSASWFEMTASQPLAQIQDSVCLVESTIELLGENISAGAVVYIERAVAEAAAVAAEAVVVAVFGTVAAVEIFAVAVVPAVVPVAVHIADELEDVVFAGILVAGQQTEVASAQAVEIEVGQLVENRIVGLEHIAVDTEGTAASGHTD